MRRSYITCWFTLVASQTKLLNRLGRREARFLDTNYTSNPVDDKSACSDMAAMSLGLKLVHSARLLANCRAMGSNKGPKRFDFSTMIAENLFAVNMKGSHRSKAGLPQLLPARTWQRVSP